MASKKRKKVSKKTRKKTGRPAGKPSKPRKKVRKKSRKLSKVERLQQQVQSLQRRLRKYEKQRFIGPLPEGKKRKPPSKTELETVRSELKLFLEGAKRGLEAQDIASKYRSHENSDHSIDAEIRVPLEDTGDIDSTFIEIEDSANWNSMGKFWVMIGINVGSEDISGSPTIDRRPHRAWTNPVRGNRAGSAFFTARETVTKKLEQWGGEFSMIVIRLYWSPYNDRPNRPRK